MLYDPNCVKHVELKSGDLLFYPVTPKSAWISKIIAIAEFLFKKGDSSIQYSHVSILDYGLLTELEAIWPKTRRHEIDFTRKPEVWRYKDITETQRILAVQWAYGHLGQRYDIGQILFGWFDLRHAEICSTFVFKAFDFAGLSFGNKPKFLTPNDLIASGKLEKLY